MKKLGLVFFIITVLFISLFACAKPDEEDKIVFSADSTYSLSYSEGLATCVMALDGNGGCVITKEYAYSEPLDESKIFSISYIERDRRIYVSYKKDIIDLTQSYSFSKQNTLVYYNSAEGVTGYYTFQEAVATNNIFEMTYQTKIENMTAQINVKIKPISYEYGEAKIALGFSITVPKYDYATGNYTIVSDQYLKLKFNYAEGEYPLDALKTYQQIATGVAQETELIEQEDDRHNGFIKIKDSSGAIRYVQLYDDGHFDFGIAVTSTSDEDLFTKDSYYGLSFTKKITSVLDGQKIDYEFNLSFDNSGNATISCISATMEKFYKAVDEGNITQIYYDIEEYRKLIGTHMQFGTSNNISIANDYNVYADYNYSRYTFSGDTQITLFRLEDCVYMSLKNENNQKISVIFYEDNTWEWVISEFSGIDLSDHSEDL